MKMKAFDIVVPRGSRGFGLSLIYRGLDKFPEPDTGIFVARVVAGGNSHRAGLRENDKILRINKRSPHDVNDAVNIIKKAGKEMVLTIGRKGQPDIVNQGIVENVEVQPEIHQPPLSRSGSVRSFNTQFAGNSRPQSPYEDSSGDEAGGESAAAVRQQQLQQYQEEEAAWQADQQRLQAQRAAMAEESRRLQAQQQEIQRQKEELLRRREQEQIRQQEEFERQQQLKQQEELRNHRLETQRGLSQQENIASIIGQYSNRSIEPDNAPMGRATDSSDDEDFFTRSRRSRSADTRRRATSRSKSPGAWSTKSGLSLHDLSELSTVSRLSRKEEKENMQGLNNRLAGYIDKVRQLQQENARMTRHVECVEISQKKEIDNIKTLYDREVSDLKTAIENLAKNYRDLQNSSDKILKTNRELKTDVSKRNSEVKMRNDLMAKLKDDLARLKNKIAAGEKERDRVEEKLKNILPELDKLQEKLSETVYQLGDVKKVNYGLDEQSKKLTSDLKGALDVMEERLTEVKVIKQIEITEITGKLEREYEDRVQKALSSLREVYENQMREGKEDFNNKYERKVRDLQSMLCEERAKNNTSVKGLEESEGRIAALVNKIKSLENGNNDMNKKINNLEKKKKDQENLHKKQIDQKEEEVKDILERIHKQMDDYQNLMDTKTALDMEIAVYRKLVESEEDRLGIDIRDDNSMSLPSSRASTPASPANKYKTVQDLYYNSPQRRHDDYSATGRRIVSQTPL